MCWCTLYMFTRFQCIVPGSQELLMVLFFLVHRVRRVQGENGGLWDLQDHLWADRITHPVTHSPTHTRTHTHTHTHIHTHTHTPLIPCIIDPGFSSLGCTWWCWYPRNPRRHCKEFKVQSLCEFCPLNFYNLCWIIFLSSGTPRCSRCSRSAGGARRGSKNSQWHVQDAMFSPLLFNGFGYRVLQVVMAATGNQDHRFVFFVMCTAWIASLSYYIDVTPVFIVCRVLMAQMVTLVRGVHRAAGVRLGDQGWKDHQGLL